MDFFETFSLYFSESEDGAEVGKTDAPVLCSSTLIDEFVQADLDVGMEYHEGWPQGDRRHVDAILHDTIQMFLSRNSLSPDTLSVIVNMLEYPPTLSSRRSTWALRPVLIDGCAVSECFHKTYPVSLRNTRHTVTASRYPCRVLFLKPIFKSLVYFLLRGHKASVLLPSCYRNPGFNSSKKKVDNAKALNLLVNLELVHFIDLDGQREMMDAMKQEVTKVGALFLSSPCSDGRVSHRRAYSTHHGTLNRYGIPPLPPAFTHASERMVTPIFFGREKNIAIVFNFTVKAEGKWHVIREDVLCSYTQLDSECISDADKLRQQLLFRKQVELLTAVKDVFEWQVHERLGIAAILRLDFLTKLSQ